MLCSWDTLTFQHAGCHGNGITIRNDVCSIDLSVLHDTSSWPSWKIYQLVCDLPLILLTHTTPTNTHPHTPGSMAMLSAVGGHSCEVL